MLVRVRSIRVGIRNELILDEEGGEIKLKIKIILFSVMGDIINELN